MNKSKENSNFTFDYKTIVKQIDFESKGGLVQLNIRMLKSVEETIDELFAAFQETGDVKPLEDFAPYFGTIWPSAKSLTNYLGDIFDESWKKLKILEVGCGLAIPSLFLAKNGCQVLTTDFHPDVREFLNQNLQLNNIRSIAYTDLDWRASKFDFIKLYGCFDIILGSDILYDKEQPFALADFLSNLLTVGGRAFIADPGRPYLQSFFNEIRVLGMKAEEVILEDNIFLIQIDKL